MNFGPDRTHVGSLATLPWRRIPHRCDAPPDGRTFLRLGLLTVPCALVAGVVALWVALRLAGTG